MATPEENAASAQWLQQEHPEWFQNQNPSAAQAAAANAAYMNNTAPRLPTYSLWGAPQYADYSQLSQADRAQYAMLEGSNLTTVYNKQGEREYLTRQEYQQRFGATPEQAEAAKHEKAWSEPRNPVQSPAERAITEQYNANRYGSFGSGTTYRYAGRETNPYPSDTAAGIQWEVQHSGGLVNPMLEAKAFAEARAWGGPALTASQDWSRPAAIDLGMHTEPIRDLSYAATQFGGGGNVVRYANTELERQAILDASNRPGFTNPFTLGDIKTEAITKGYSMFYSLMGGARSGLASPDLVLGRTIETQREAAFSTPGRRDERFFGNELQKWAQNKVELSSAYHNIGMIAGIPIPANRFEYQGDLAVEFLKGTPQRAVDRFSPVSGEMSAYLPGVGHKYGLQEYAWDEALAYDRGQPMPGQKLYMNAVEYLGGGEGRYGPYGKLYGGIDNGGSIGGVPYTRNAPMIDQGATPTPTLGLPAIQGPAQAGQGGDLLGGIWNAMINAPTLIRSGLGVSAEPGNVTVSRGDLGGMPMPYLSVSRAAEQQAAKTPVPSFTPTTYFQELSNAIMRSGDNPRIASSVLSAEGNYPASLISGGLSIFGSAYDLGKNTKGSNAINEYLSNAEAISNSQQFPGSVITSTLGNIYKGGNVFELKTDFENTAAATTERIQPMLSKYESDITKYEGMLSEYNAQKSQYEGKLSEYNSALEAYNKNKTPEGYSALLGMEAKLNAMRPDAQYNALQGMQASLNAQKSAIDIQMAPAKDLEYRYNLAAADLTGNVNQKELTLYGAGNWFGDIGKGYESTIETPARAAMAPYGFLGDVAVGIASVPRQIATIAQAGLIGGETIARNAENFPGLATAGLAMQIKDTYKLGTTHPGELLGNIAGMAILGAAAKGAIGRTAGFARTRGMDYVPVENIGYDTRMGFAIGEPTEAGLRTSFERGTLEPTPNRMSLNRFEIHRTENFPYISTRTNEVPYISGQGERPFARLPGQEGETVLWTAHEYNTLTRGVNPGEAYRINTPGSSEVSGVYGASTLMSYFAKVGGQIPKMIGFDSPVKSPVVYSTVTEGLESAPRWLSRQTARDVATGTPGAYDTMNAYFQGAATERPGSLAFMPLTKSEYEAVVIQNSIMEVTGRRYYTKLGGFGESHFLGTRVPIVEQRVIGFEPGETPGIRTRTPSEEYSGRRPVITPSTLALSASSNTLSASAPSPLERMFRESDKTPSRYTKAYQSPETAVSERAGSSRMISESPLYKTTGRSPSKATTKSSELYSPLRRSSLISPGKTSPLLLYRSTLPDLTTATPPYSPPTYSPPPYTPGGTKPYTPPTPPYTPPPETPPIITGDLPYSGSYGWGSSRFSSHRKFREVFSFEQPEDIIGAGIGSGAFQPSPQKKTQKGKTSAPSIWQDLLQ